VPQFGASFSNGRYVQIHTSPVECSAVGVWSACKIVRAAIFPDYSSQYHASSTRKDAGRMSLVDLCPGLPELYLNEYQYATLGTQCARPTDNHPVSGGLGCLVIVADDCVGQDSGKSH
jgi:hypothetical protein